MALSSTATDRPLTALFLLFGEGSSEDVTTQLLFSEFFILTIVINPFPNNKF